jgi:hypothetical protein
MPLLCLGSCSPALFASPVDSLRQAGVIFCKRHEKRERGDNEWFTHLAAKSNRSRRCCDAVPGEHEDFLRSNCRSLVPFPFVFAQGQGPRDDSV